MSPISLEKYLEILNRAYAMDVVGLWYREAMLLNAMKRKAPFNWIAVEPKAAHTLDGPQGGGGEGALGRVEGL